MASNDPDFETKAADIIGLYLNPDNLSAHKSAPVKEFLEAHPKVHLHFTPTYSSWLNQVELWFNRNPPSHATADCVRGIRTAKRIANPNPAPPP